MSSIAQNNSGGSAETTPQDTGNHSSQNNERRLWYNATITSLAQLTPTVKGVTLQVDTRQGDASSPEFTFLPGQWVDFYIPSLNKIGGYSITSLPSHLPRLELAVKKSRHPPAAWVTNEARVGDTVTLRVGGEFVYDKSVEGECTSSGVLFVAGGVGINPLYGMLRQLQASNPKKRAALLYSASTDDELLFERELSAMASSCFRMSYHVTKGGKSEAYRKGRISSKEIGEALDWIKGEGEGIPAVYICGPPGMAEEMADACKEHGIPRSSVHFEQWW